MYLVKVKHLWRTYWLSCFLISFCQNCFLPPQISDIAPQICSKFHSRTLWSNCLLFLLSHYFWKTWIWVNWFFHLFLLLIRDLNPFPSSSIPLNTNYCLGSESRFLPYLWLDAFAVLDSFQSRKVKSRPFVSFGSHSQISNGNRPAITSLL